MYQKFIVPALIGFTVTLAANGVIAGPLENLERERAIAVETLLSTSINTQEKQDKVNVSKRRLVDLERMVIRDKSIASKNTPIVRAAFDNYDLTFLVHASTENQRSLMDHWLKQVGVSTNAVMTARIGRR
ncbi:MAG: hypothetical protein P8J29_06925 [Rhodospirillales bacterium]|nr:hypothetical protein [Rhodospirillales bacterium]